MNLEDEELLNCSLCESQGMVDFKRQLFELYLYPHFYFIIRLVLNA